MKHRIHYLVLLAAAVAWSVTFIAAFSDCNIQQIFRLECRDFTFGADTSAGTDAAKNAAALKGQFGDLFGVLNGVFGAVTLYLVYLAYLRERTASETQVDLARRERYYTEVDGAIASYNRLLDQILVQTSDSQSRNVTQSATHGLFRLWRTHITKSAIRTRLEASVGYRQTLPKDEDAPNTALGPIWSLLGRQYDSLGSVPAIEIESMRSADVADAIGKLSDEVKAEFVGAIALNWRRCYAENEYQLDALFRAWYHVCKSIATAASRHLDAETEWQMAGRWRAQLSWIELAFLLANQLLSESPGFPRSIDYSSRYAMFDNLTAGADPIIHVLRQTIESEEELYGLPKLPVTCLDSRLALAALKAVHEKNRSS